MRKKTVQVLLGAALIAAMCLGAPTAAFADETNDKGGNRRENWR